MTSRRQANRRRRYHRALKKRCAQMRHGQYCLPVYWAQPKENKP